MPAVTVLVFCPGDNGVVTAIGRRWHPGDAARCRLCERCSAIPGERFDGCLVVADGYVSEADAPCYSRVGKARQCLDPIVIEGPPRAGSAAYLA